MAKTITLLNKLTTMTHKSFKRISWSLALLASVSASAQDFDSELQLSGEGTTYWYRICNASSGMDCYAMTDCSDLVDDCPLQLLATETENTKSQWKLTAGEDGKIIITNRATGQQINGSSVAAENINITQLIAEGSQGFIVTELGDNAFSLQSVEDDGINRCLALAEEGGEALTYPESSESSSIIGWKFFPVEIETSIGSAKTNNAVIRVNGKRISVSGCSGWQLYNASGEEMPRTISLPTGVYLVKMPQKSVKILIP